jgi:hypothetical protein
VPAWSVDTIKVGAYIITTAELGEGPSIHLPRKRFARCGTAVDVRVSMQGLSFRQRPYNGCPDGFLMFCHISNCSMAAPICCAASETCSSPK